MQGPGLQERAGDFLGSGMLMTDGAAWKRHRRIASTEFSTSKLRDHCDTVFREGAIKLANVLKSAMAVKDPVEIQVSRKTSENEIELVAFRATEVFVKDYAEQSLQGFFL